MSPNGWPPAPSPIWPRLLCELVPGVRRLECTLWHMHPGGWLRATIRSGLQHSRSDTLQPMISSPRACPVAGSERLLPAITPAR